MVAFDVEETLKLLTIEEKISLLSGSDSWHTYPVPRLNIPKIRVSDGPNGIRGTKFFDGKPSACFPCGTALASTFDKQLLEESGKLMAEEAKHKSAHVILGPTANMQRGPLGGRGFESFSEDPYLAGIASASIINGMQSQGIAATMKHFVGNDLEDDRYASDSIITERALREIYLEPFRLAVKHSQPKAIMTSYNKVNGEHVSQSKRLLDTILRKEWNWDGTLMSDWFGTYTTKAAIEGGLDIEMPGPTRFRTIEYLSHQIRNNELHINDLDDRVRGVLKLVYYASKANIPEDGPEDSENNSPETREFLRKIASESIVVLKNEKLLLPLKKTDKIAVIGPNARISTYCGGGSASLTSYYTTTPFDSITEKLESKPQYIKGCDAHNILPGVHLAPEFRNSITGDSTLSLSFYKEAPNSESRTLFDQKTMEISQFFLYDYEHPAIENGLYYIDFEGDLVIEEKGEYEFGLTVLGTAQLFIDGKLVVDNKTVQTKGSSFFDSGTIEERNTHVLEKGVHKLKVEFGSIRTYTIGGGNLSTVSGGGIFIGFNKVTDTQQNIREAVELAKSVDKVILNIGLNQEWESEGYDRANMDLPLATNELVEAVLEANSNTVIVNQSGTPVEFPWLEKASTLIHAWYGGSETGNAIADVIFGDVNPSGKLSLSFPLRNVDNPAYLNFKTVNGRVLYGEDIYIGYRFYEKLERQVAFPFGHGLSYTTFSYSNIQVSADESSDSLKVSLNVKNTGNITGKEVIQLYVSSNDSVVPRPFKELKGFEKVSLNPGEDTNVSFELSLKDSISFWDEYQDKWFAQKGKFSILLGKSSDNIELTQDFEVKAEKYWLGL